MRLAWPGKGVSRPGAANLGRRDSLLRCAGNLRASREKLAKGVESSTQPYTRSTRERPLNVPRCSKPSTGHGELRVDFIPLIPPPVYQGLGLFGAVHRTGVILLPGRGHARTFLELFRKRDKAFQTGTCAGSYLKRSSKYATKSAFCQLRPSS